MSKTFRLPFLPRVNSVLTQMPVLRVTVEVLHPGSFTKDSAAAAAQKILARESAHILAYYQAQQANSFVSDLPLSQTHRVANNVEVRHTNLNGTPILDVKITVDADEDDDTLCLLVLHGDQEIMAIPMASVYKETYKPIYKATSKTGWAELGSVEVVQERLYKDVSAISAPMDISTSTISLNGAGVTVVTRTKVFGPTNTGYGYVLNGSGSVTGVDIYTDYGAHSFANGRVTRVSTPGANAEAVTSGGDYKYYTVEGGLDSEGYGSQLFRSYFMMTSVGNGTPHVEPPTYVEKTGTYEATREKLLDSSVRILVPPDPPPPGNLCASNGPWTTRVVTGTGATMKAVRSTFDGIVTRYEHYPVVEQGSWNKPLWFRTMLDTYGTVDLQLSTTGQTLATAGGGTVTTHSAGEDAPPGSDYTTTYDVGHNTGVFNEFGYQADNMIINPFDLTLQDIPGWVASINATFCGYHHISTQVTYTSLPGYWVPGNRLEASGNDAPVYYHFPYGVGGTLYSTLQGTLRTPHETLPFDGGFSGMFNLHNGGVLIQMSRLGYNDGSTDYLLYVNGKRLTDVAGVPLSSINAMFLDIPLKHIKQFK